MNREERNMYRFIIENHHIQFHMSGFMPPNIPGNEVQKAAYCFLNLLLIKSKLPSITFSFKLIL